MVLAYLFNNSQGVLVRHCTLVGFVNNDASLCEAPEYSPLSGIGSPIAYSFEDEDMSEESDHVSECQQDVENERYQ